MAALLVIVPARGTAALGSTPLMAQAAPEARTVLSVRYRDGKSAKLELAGTTLSPRTFGKVEAEARRGAVSVKVKMEGLDAPSRLGPYYTTFVPAGRRPACSASPVPPGEARPLDAIDDPGGFLPRGGR